MGNDDTRKIDFSARTSSLFKLEFCYLRMCPSPATHDSIVLIMLARDVADALAPCQIDLVPRTSEVVESTEDSSR